MPSSAPVPQPSQRAAAYQYAFDAAWRSITARNTFASSKVADRVRRRLAKTIVSLSKRGETDPRTAEARFFVELKRATARAYYTSRVGIHDEIGYKGNTYLEQYVGFAPDDPLPAPE